MSELSVTKITNIVDIQGVYFTSVNAAYAAANSAVAASNSAYTAANSAVATAAASSPVSAFNQANTAYTTANTVNTAATAAFAKANTALQNTTSTFAGTLTITGALGVGATSSAVSGEIRAANNITAYYTSDIKFKENVQDIQNALDIVKSIGGKTFDWTNDYINMLGGEDGYFVQKSDFGVIAQDVKSVFPIATRVKPEGTLVVDYEKLCAIAFAAIKELTTRVEELESK